MPVNQEFTVLMEDRPGTLGKSLPRPRRSQCKYSRASFLPDRRDRASGVAPGRGQHQYQLRILRLGIRYECATGLLWCHGSRSCGTNSGTSRGRRCNTIEPKKLSSFSHRSGRGPLPFHLLFAAILPKKGTAYARGNWGDRRCDLERTQHHR